MRAIPAAVLWAAPLAAALVVALPAAADTLQDRLPTCLSCHGE
ncbi:MAG: hypothetical protein QOG74_1230, partial [Alphaproteobacteria bacterium]|nr:hypothetical protein [Alphaproteobacteria bacterium]